MTSVQDRGRFYKKRSSIVLFDFSLPFKLGDELFN